MARFCTLGFQNSKKINFCCLGDKKKKTPISEEERSQISNLSFYLNKVEKEKKTKLKARRRNEIIKISMEINDIKNRRNQ